MLVKLHGDHVLLGRLDTLANCIGHLSRLAHAHTDMAFAIADNDQGAELERPSTFNHLCHAVNLDDALLQLHVFGVHSCI